ncbi:MAG TPA: 2-dehydropantoate 2-reductase N-terminal domain-containing protein, partial [Candidatus Angelobacter sp.]|nr:2-dehydropantoate 2-reductase N-terminal domain-containing protein [Candidatus Angelobacter sp.]
MTITVVGAGAIGGVLGAHLIKAGENVIFCDIAADHVDTMNKKGLTIESEHETFTVPCVAYTPAQLVERQEPLDKVFLCVKAQHTTDALSSLVPLLNDIAYVVSFQNGLCEREIASLVGKERTVGCFVNFSADYLGPG